MKVILITGCSSGFGYEAAKLFTSKGYKVIAGMEKKTELGLLPGSVWLDVTWDEEKIQDVIKDLGRIDVLVNNAGFGYLGAVGSFSYEQIREQFETNVFGLVKVTNAVLPIMRKQKSGKIINISSTAGYFSGPSYGVYCASKYAVEAISQALRAEEHHYGITVAVVNPGSFKTKFWEHIRFAGDTQKLEAFILKLHQIHRPNSFAVAKKILQVIKESNSRKTNLVGLDAYGLHVARYWIPFGIVDWIMKKIARQLS